MDIKRMFELLNIKLIKTATIANNNVYIFNKPVFYKRHLSGQERFLLKMAHTEKD